MSKEQTDWVLVPREATSEMCRAQPDNASTDDVEFYRSKWRAMLSAAPASPSPAGGVQAVTDGEAVEELSKLVEYFRGEGYLPFGHEGDFDGLSPAETAIRAMREFAALSSQAQTTGGVE